MNLNGTFRSYFGAVAVPIIDKGDGTISNVTHDWANATAGLGGGLAVTVLRMQIRNYRVDIAKEKLAEMALQNNCQFILFIDDDVVPPGDALLKMVRLWRSDPKYKIINGIYWSKSEPPNPLMFDFDKGLQGSKWDWHVGDLIQADAGGFGLTFVDTDVLKKMSKPWFSCNYYFEDPRADLDVKKWQLMDQLGGELLKGKHANKKAVEEMEQQMRELGEEIQQADQGNISPELLHNKRNDGNTTEDLYFYKKAAEELGIRPWFDTSIQAIHQDKTTGRSFGIQPDMPQARPRYEGKMERGNKVVIDLGAGDSQYWVPDGVPVRVDLDPATKPDIVSDVRFLHMFNDCIADVVYASHVLEHISFKETVSTLTEWVRVLKVGGKLVIVVPNLKWAARRIVDGPANQAEAERAMYMHYSAQKGDLRSAYQDVHKAGFTMESLRGVLSRISDLENIQVFTTAGNYGNWEDENNLHEDDEGYNIIAFARKKEHSVPSSLKMPLDQQKKIASSLTVDEDPIPQKKIDKKIVKQQKAKTKKNSKKNKK